jgi:hypothetical protein
VSAGKFKERVAVSAIVAALAAVPLLIGVHLRPSPGEFRDFEGSIEHVARVSDGDWLFTLANRDDLIVHCPHSDLCAKQVEQRAGARVTFTGHVYQGEASRLGGSDLPLMAIDQFKAEQHLKPAAAVLALGETPDAFVAQSHLAFGFAGALVLLGAALFVFSLVKRT